MKGTIPTIPSMGRGNEVSVDPSGENYLRDTAGNLILDSSGNPIEIIGS
jgi:hypothetical protein